MAHSELKVEISMTVSLPEHVKEQEETEPQLEDISLEHNLYFIAMHNQYHAITETGQVKDLKDNKITR